MALKRAADRPPIGIFLLLFAAMVSGALCLAALSARADLPGDADAESTRTSLPAVGPEAAPVHAGAREQEPINAVNAQGARQ